MVFFGDVQPSFDSSDQRSNLTTAVETSVLRFYTKEFINAFSKVPFTFSSQVPAGFYSVKQMVQENIDLIITIYVHVWFGPFSYPEPLVNMFVSLTT